MRCGLPQPLLNEPVRDSFGRLIGVGDLVWKEQRVIGEYQGEEFHDSPDQRHADAGRRGRFRRNGWRGEEIWKADLESAVARHACVIRFAEALEVPLSQLALGNAEPRFFSTHAMELTIQRDLRIRRRTA